MTLKECVVGMAKDYLRATADVNLCLEEKKAAELNTSTSENNTNAALNASLN